MKNLILATFFLASAFLSHSQFKQLVVKQVDNGGVVPGKTYRVYVELMNDKNDLRTVYGDTLHPMIIESTKPFYQNPYGGAMANEVNNILAQEKTELRYDSWVTIGRENNLDNAINNFQVKFENFEKGGKIETYDGAWFCTPDHKQTWAKDNNMQILIGQFTSEGKVTGIINLMGKDNEGAVWQETNVKFTCGK
ncbi:MAG: hypothetical protein SH856_13010 [Flavobacteriales bacterium]|nr:hypothetical protein [Flavobacteriales bacterium]